MISKAGIKLTMVLMFVSFIGLSFADLNQEADYTVYIQATPDELVLDGWLMITPTVNEDSITGDNWVQYDFPDGNSQSYPIGPGDPITERWYKPGAKGAYTTPGSYSIKATKNIKNWYKNGGVGTYKLENGQWISVSEEPTPPLVVPGTDLSAGMPLPFPRPSASGPVDAAPEFQGFVARVNEARKACYDVPYPDPKDCKIYEELYKKYKNRIGNP